MSKPTYEAIVAAISDAVSVEQVAADYNYEVTGQNDAAAAVVALYAPVVAELEKALAEVERLRSAIWSAQNYLGDDNPKGDELCFILGHTPRCKSMIMRGAVCNCGGVEVSE